MSQQYPPAPPPGPSPSPAAEAGQVAPQRPGLPGWAIGAIVAGAVVLVGAAVGGFFLLKGDEPKQAPVTQAPATAAPIEASAALPDLPPDQIAQFDLVGVEPAPDFAADLDGSEAVLARYARGDGMQILHYLVVYPNDGAAALGRENLIRGMESVGYTVVDQARERGINVYRLAGDNEVLIWTNGAHLATVEGPFDTTTGFFFELPY